MNPEGPAAGIFDAWFRRLGEFELSDVQVGGYSTMLGQILVSVSTTFTKFMRMAYAEF